MANCDGSTLEIAVFWLIYTKFWSTHPNIPHPPRRQLQKNPLYQPHTPPGWLFTGPNLTLMLAGPTKYEKWSQTTFSSCLTQSHPHKRSHLKSTFLLEGAGLGHGAGRTARFGQCRQHGNKALLCKPQSTKIIQKILSPSLLWVTNRWGKLWLSSVTARSAPPVHLRNNTLGLTLKKQTVSGQSFFTISFPEVWTHPLLQQRCQLSTLTDTKESPLRAIPGFWLCQGSEDQNKTTRKNTPPDAEKLQQKKPKN